MPYDANGNVQVIGANGWGLGFPYDVENRQTQEGVVVNGGAWITQNGYDPSGKRVTQLDAVNSQIQNERIRFYSITGQRLGTYTLSADGTYFSQTSLNLYFGGKLMRSAGVTVATDRLGSVRGNSNGERMAYWPFGQERTSTADGREKFGTYFRDPSNYLYQNNFDYADQRYYTANAGRFNTPDPKGLAAVDLKDPTSWNMYAYAGDDPVNFKDPRGLDRQAADDESDPSYCDENPVDLGCLPPAVEQRGGRATAREAARWDKAEEVLSNGNDLLHKVLNDPSQPCQGDLNALQNIGVSSPGILAMADTADWKDAFGDQALAIGLFSPSDPNYAFYQQHLTGVTIAQYVSGGTTAATAVPGSALWGNIYFNGSYVAGLSTQYAAALLVRELSHTLAAADPQIQTALYGAGSPQVGANSVNITQKLFTDCFK